MSCEIETLCDGYVAILQLMNGMLIIGKVTSSRLSYSFACNFPPLSISGYDQGNKHTCVCR